MIERDAANVFIKKPYLVIVDVKTDHSSKRADSKAQLLRIPSLQIAMASLCNQSFADNSGDKSRAGALIDGLKWSSYHRIFLESHTAHSAACTTSRTNKFQVNFEPMVRRLGAR
jgi:hypothetical protein